MLSDSKSMLSTARTHCSVVLSWALPLLWVPLPYALLLYAPHSSGNLTKKEYIQETIHIGIEKALYSRVLISPGVTVERKRKHWGPKREKSFSNSNLDLHVI